jgi:hypothetical protein
MAPSKKKRKQPSSLPSSHQPDSSSLLVSGKVESQKTAHPSRDRHGRTHTNQITCKTDPLVDINGSSDVLYATSNINVENESNKIGVAMMGGVDSETSILVEGHGTYHYGN